MRAPIRRWLAVVAVIASACAPARERLDEGDEVVLDGVAVTNLRVADRQIVDDAGRHVIVRALQHHALQDVDYGGREVQPDDYERIASWGFTAIRVAISWSRIEPSRGAYDAAYLDELGDVLDRAHAAKLGVILEWHHDLWGRCTQAPEAGLRTSANGAPDWTCPADLVRGVFGHWGMFDRLYANTGGLEDAYLAAWAQVLARVGAHPALIGVEPFNEPQGTGGTPALERDAIYPAYRRWVPALRAAGARGLVFLDAPILRNEVTDMHTERLDDLDQAVFAPHLYSGWLRLYLLHGRIADDVKAKDFEAAVAQAHALGLPLWNGEWGVNLELAQAEADLGTHVALEDIHRIGSSYWAFQRVAAGPGWATGPQALLDEAGVPRPGVLSRLSRPYPIATPGELAQLDATEGLRIRYRATSTSPLVLFLPASHVGTTPCFEARVDGEPVGWRYMRLAGEQVAIALPAGVDVELDVRRCD